MMRRLPTRFLVRTLGPAAWFPFLLALAADPPQGVSLPFAVFDSLGSTQVKAPGLRYTPTGQTDFNGIQYANTADPKDRIWLTTDQHVSLTSPRPLSLDGKTGQRDGDCFNINHSGESSSGTVITPPPSSAPIPPGSEGGSAASGNTGGGAPGVVSGGGAPGGSPGGTTTITPAVPGGNPPIAGGGGGAPAGNGSGPGSGPITGPGGGYSTTPLDQVTDEARGTELFDTARARQQVITAAAANDQGTIAKQYQQLTPEAYSEHIDRALTRLDDITQSFDQMDPQATAKSGLSASEQARFKNVFLNARDKAQLAKDLLNEGEREKFNPLVSTPLAGFLSAQIPNPLARTQALSDLFGPTLSPKEAATPDALVNRTLMFQGLPDLSRKETVTSLKLYEAPPLVLQDGRQVRVPLLHNGYIFGGGGTAVDCSSFITQSLPVELRKTRYTTLDFRSMWLFLKTGTLPFPPKYAKDRAKIIRQAADAFIPIDVYSGQRLMVGDLLVYRLPDETAGHVFLVKHFNPSTWIVDVMEAAQSAGTVREREFPLSADPPGARQRFIRAGLLALRLKPVNNRGCSYTEKKTPVRKGGRS